MASETRSEVLEGRGLEGGEAPRGSDEGANGRQSKILDSESSGITSDVIPLLCETKILLWHMIPLLWLSKILL